MFPHKHWAWRIGVGLLCLAGWLLSASWVSNHGRPAEAKEPRASATSHDTADALRTVSARLQGIERRLADQSRRLALVQQALEQAAERAPRPNLEATALDGEALDGEALEATALDGEALDGEALDAPALSELNAPVVDAEATDDVGDENAAASAAAVVDGALASGTWTERDSQRLERELRQMPPAQAEQTRLRLIAALNRGDVRAEFTGRPPF